MGVTGIWAALQAFFRPIWESIRGTAVYLPRLAVLVIVFGGLYLALRLALGRVERMIDKTLRDRQSMPREQEKRIRTIARIARGILVAIFWVVAAIVLLGEVGVEIGPILAAAGVAGLAVSFGAQSLVKDVISGFFILAEDQVRIGDVAVVNGTGGLVEQINLRTIVLRDLAGAVHVFPNGSITTLANLTKDWSGYVFNIGVSFREDVDRVIEVIRRVADELAGDERFRDRILEPVEIFGLDKIGESALIVQGRIKTLPIEQWSVGREFNRRIKQAFDAEGIAFPFPSRTITFGDQDGLLRALRGEGKDPAGGGPAAGERGGGRRALPAARRAAGGRGRRKGPGGPARSGRGPSRPAPPL